MAPALTAATAVGTGWKTYPALVTELANVSLNENILLPDAKYMLAWVATAFASGDTVTAANAQPKYVRDTVTWKKLPGRE